MPEKPIKKKSQRNRYLALTSISFQIGIIIYLGVLLGEYIDAKYNFEKPWFTILCVLFALIVSVYSVIQQLNKLNKKNE